MRELYNTDTIFILPGSGYQNYPHYPQPVFPLTFSPATVPYYSPSLRNAQPHHLDYDVSYVSNTQLPVEPEVVGQTMVQSKKKKNKNNLLYGAAGLAGGYFLYNAYQNHKNQQQQQQQYYYNQQQYR